LRPLIAGVIAGILAEILIEHPFWWWGAENKIDRKRRGCYHAFVGVAI